MAGPCLRKRTVALLNDQNPPTIRAYADGKELDAAQLADKLAKTTHVLISTKKVDPFYLDVFKEGTIQLVLPASLVNQDQGPAGYFRYAPMQSAPVAAPEPAQ